MAEGSALQAGRLWRQGLCLQLKGVTKGARSEAVQGLDSNPEKDGGERERCQHHRASRSQLTGSETLKVNVT